ncbi:hypothetical protein JM47_01265 [Ureaplasma diversum]|uniref:ABC3 transporter permease C-terminal domain-containing protein n=1 Tax=Ureaplasma diversum TaxID=42094 RepID=A0A0C5RKR9_9BACT|nr:ABC transporter permease [Ureaplasma diversum]AJQ45248.1 hypothetical protein JM47_01265 [Ureaplasma diversum]
MFKKLIKNVYRYLNKSKASFFGLCILLFITIFSFLLLNNVSQTITRSYNKLVTEQKLHDVVVNESYSEEGGEAKKAAFYKDLDQLKTFYASKDQLFDYNPHQSLLVNSASNNITYKIVEYSTKQKINTFSAETNKRLESAGFDSIDLRKIFNNASSDVVDFLINNNKTNPNHNLYKITNETELLESKKDLKPLSNILDVDQMDLSSAAKARIYLLKNIVNGAWEFDDDDYRKLFIKAYEYAQSDQNYDPLLANVADFSKFSAADANAVQKQFIAILYPSKKGIEINTEASTVVKEHRIAFSFIRAGIPIPVYFDVKSAYAIVGFKPFIDNQKKQLFDLNTWNEAIKKYQRQSVFEAWFASIDDKYKLKVDSTEFVLLDTGITPDFMYPIVSFASVIPNPVKEGLVYVNKNGFYRIYDAFRSNPIERMLHIVLKNKDGSSLKSEEYKALVSDLNKMIQTKAYMNWPSSIPAAYIKDDTNNKITPSPLRIVFVSQITTYIKTFSLIITLFIMIFAIFVVAIIVRRFIAQNKINIGISLANGVEKWKLITSFGLIGLIPSLLGGIIGLVGSHFAQPLGITLISNYWLLPTEFESFNFLNLFLVVILPFLFLFGLIASLSWWSLKKNPIDLMRGSETHKISWIVKYIKKPFAYGSAFGRYTITLSFKSLSQIFILGSMIAFSFSLIMFLSATKDKIENTTQSTLLSNKYKYAIELSTPTIEGGQYHSADIERFGSTITVKSNDPTQKTDNIIDQKYESSDYDQFIKLKTKLNGLNLIKDLSNLKLIGAKDAERKSYDLLYIANAFQAKQFLDFNFGISGAGSSTNPWSITKSLIPENTLQEIEKHYKLWGTSLVNDHLILDAKSSDKVAKIAHEILNINDVVDEFEFNNVNQFNTLVSTQTAKLKDDSLKQNKTYSFKGIIFDQNMNLFAFNGSMVYENKFWRLVINNKDQLEKFINLNRIANNKMFISSLSYQVQNKDNKLDTKYIIKHDDLVYDELFFLTNINNQQKTEINKISLSSYFRSKFLKQDPNGEFEYIYNYDPILIKKELFENIDNNVIKIVIDPDAANPKTVSLSFNSFTDLEISNGAQAYEFKITNKNTNQTITIIRKPKKIYYSVNSQAATNSLDSITATKLADEFINLVLLTHPSINEKYYHTWSGVMFNSIGLDYRRENKQRKVIEHDEPYIWVDSTITKINNLDYTSIKNNKIMGLIDNTRLVDLYSNNQKINSLLTQRDDALIINQNTAKAHNLKIGDQITFKIHNSADRYQFNFTKKSVTLTVVGINDTYQDQRMYTSIETARKILNLKESPYSEKFNFIGYKGAFNGILTNKLAPEILTRMVPIYSPSGLYPTDERWKKDAFTLKLIENVLNTNNKFKEADLNNPKSVLHPILESQKRLVRALGYSSLEQLQNDAINVYDQNKNIVSKRTLTQQAEWIIDQLINKFGYDTYLSMVQNVEAVDVMFEVLRTASNTITSVQIVVISIFLLIILLLVILMTANSVFDIAKVVALLKNMGYSDLKNAVLFVTTFITPFTLGLLLSIPLTTLIIDLFTKAIFSAIGVLITTGFVWWHFLVITLVVLGGLLSIWLIALYLLKRTNVVNASKRA